MADAASGLRRWVQQSIFVKLFLIYAATTLALVVAVSGYSRLVLHNDDVFKQTRSRMIAHNLHSLVAEMGTPPTQERALALSRQLGVDIRAEGPTVRWTTEPSLPADAELKPEHTYADSGMTMGRYHGRRFASLDHEGTRFVFFFPGPPELEWDNIAVLIALIGLIVTCSYLAVRWLFRPLQWLMSGMSEIAKGRLSHQVPMRVPDELGRLTVALNEMVARIREMICARERLLLDVSHELRSPLTRMKVAVEFLPDASTRERLQDELRELEAMVTELLESERLKSEYGGITPANTDLVELVRDVAQAYDAHAPGVRIIGPTSVIVPLDGRRVRAALRNVLENALKHTAPEAGPVQIRIDTREREARVIVRDHGPGVPPDQRALIFEPFYRVDKSRTRSTGGYGLGLSLVKTIMAAHGGDVRVADAPDHGSEFILTFPCSAIAHGSLTEAVPLVGHGQS